MFLSLLSGVFFWPTGCSLRLSDLPGDEVDDTLVGSFRGCFVGSFLDSDIFPCGGEVERIAYLPLGPTDHSC
jgi:hypothetical protein